MENERKRVDVKLVTEPNFHSSDIFYEDLVVVQLLRTEICIRKPIYIGLTVLDLSKTLVRFGEKVAAYAVTNTMKLKSRFGMGLKKQKSSKRTSKKRKQNNSKKLEWV